jgi:bifunctional UDP-N-acetylglucosamine pyrophosphorylase/glucosamine-1-phosphate N-acetyltransferase
MSTVAVVLAAGLGKRMKSRCPKVLHPILGDPSLLWVLRALPPGTARALVVVHHGAEEVTAALEAWGKAGLLPCAVEAVDQGRPLGTGHALQVCSPRLDQLGARQVVILCGDVPLIAPATVAGLCEGPPVLLALDLADPTGYGRVLEGAGGELAGLVEEKDASPEQRRIRRVNGGAYGLPWELLKPALSGLSDQNAQGEYYLTDAVADLARRTRVEVRLCDPAELTGMNSRADQARLQALARDRANARWMEAGVGFLDPASAWIGPRVELDADVVLEPGVRLEGGTAVAEGASIGQGCVLVDAVVGPGTRIRPYSLVEGARIGTGCVVGPFARLREGTVLEDGVHIGNFVETKKAVLAAGAKANHLAYLGDASVGEGTNIGAGVITCNYDGVSKHRTEIGAGVFVGSDTQLVAPVVIGDGAIIGAGSTITEDVPPGALALSRTAQVVREDGAGRLRAKLRAKLG